MSRLNSQLFLTSNFETERDDETFWSKIIFFLAIKVGAQIEKALLGINSPKTRIKGGQGGRQVVLHRLSSKRSSGIF